MYEHVSKAEKIYASGCLTPEKHGPLVAEIDKFAAIAGLGGGNMRYIWEPIGNVSLTKGEIGILQNIKKLAAQGKGGVLYVGENPSAIVKKLMALTGCMLRNYVDARFMPLESVIEEYNQHK